MHEVELKVWQYEIKIKVWKDIINIMKELATNWCEQYLYS